ncbi:hypothetical protein QVD17_11151 [Tagetes erecta]|uniref:Uncharacterized protein n=1 Tax=Tagetes erecta TaxID=13708 RepID=A0AAD8L998_TARER|nr:hypothetical protein QVD17_11151 [Tagetes erecta]
MHLRFLICLCFGVEMSTTVMSDAVMMPVTETSTVTVNMNSPATEVEFAECDCCGLTEECTPEYMERIRERYKGKWICGLCGEAVKDEIVRSERLISTEEAMMRHMTFRKASRSSGPPPNPAVHLITAMRQILRRSLDSSAAAAAAARSMPSSPAKRNDIVGIVRSESCIPTLTLTVESTSSSSSYDDFEEPAC